MNAADVMITLDRALGPQHQVRAEVGKLIRRNNALEQELRATKTSYMRLIRTLASIHMRCAAADFTVENGDVIRFVPPNPEFYWRELSESIKRIESDMRAAFDEEDAALASWKRKDV